jgi:hypothetical protein
VCSIKDLGFHLCDQTIWFITDFINFNIQKLSNGTHCLSVSHLNLTYASDLL